MPIPTAQLAEAQKPLEGRILQLLDAHPESAFSLVEIISSIEYVGSQAGSQILLALLSASNPGVYSALGSAYKKALDQLCAAGRIHAADLHGETYYTAGQLPC